MTQIDLPAFEREWIRFESWLCSNSPADHAMLRRPAERDRLIALESRLGFDLHPELKDESLRDPVSASLPGRHTT
ncbi:hypothetical protein [Streptomyces sp. NPDC003393]